MCMTDAPLNWSTGSEGEQDPMSSYRVSIGCLVCYVAVMKVRYLLFEVFCFGDVLSYCCAPVGVIIIILSMFYHSAGSCWCNRLQYGLRLCHLTQESQRLG